MTKALVPTVRDDPAEAETAGHRLLVRGGFVRSLSQGLIHLLPLGVRVMRRIEAVLREEMDALGAQEVSMPVVQPAEIWEQSGRWQAAGPELARLTDRSGRALCLAMTHEEAVTDLVRGTVKSFRDLPLCLYQLQTKFRDEPRSRAGLIRVREFVMKDAYSFHPDQACLDGFYEHMGRAYARVFARLGLPVKVVEADPGMMGGARAHEYMALAELGEDTVLSCGACGYAANRQVATFKKPGPVSGVEASVAEVATPGCTTIAQLARFLGVGPEPTMKAVFYSAPDLPLLFVLVRGDMQVNDAKLARAVGAATLRPATEAEIAAIGAVPGYAGPLGLSGEYQLVVDDLLMAERDLVTGANRAGFHLTGVAPGRDFKPGLVADLVTAEPGYPCPYCGGALEAARAVEVGNTFKLGTRYSDSMKARFLDRDGRTKPLVMGCYGIGPGRLMGTLAELNRDPAGLVWPVSVAPYGVHLVSLPGKDPVVAGAAERLYGQLQSAGLEVLYDDRAGPAAGEKFADADLVGAPVRLTLGARGLKEGLVDLKLRRGGDPARVALDAAAGEVRATLARLGAELEATVPVLPGDEG